MKFHNLNMFNCFFSVKVHHYIHDFVVVAHVEGTAPWNMHVFALQRIKSYA